MSVIIGFTIFLYIVVAYRGYQFFVRPGGCPDRDKSTVASLVALSLMAIVAHVMVWGASPWEIHGGIYGNSLLMAFSFSNAMFYAAHIEALTERKECPTSQLNS